MASHSLPNVPRPGEWVEGLRLEPSHFRGIDARINATAYLHGLVSHPWPWGFLECAVDETALASSQLRVSCEGVLPGGAAFARTALAHMLPSAAESRQAEFYVTSGENAQKPNLTLQPGKSAPGEGTLPAARLLADGGTWSLAPDWSPPALLVGPDHPLRVETRHQLGGLAAIAAGFLATLRMPGAGERPAARTIFQVASALAQGVTVIEALLAAPAVAPGALGLEALRLAAAVRAATGTFDPVSEAWDPADQRGSLRRILYIAESTASGVGLPFRALRFTPGADPQVLQLEGLPLEPLLLVIEASQPADLIAARSWLEGAAVASPDRVQVAITRRVGGCARRLVERDPRLGVSAGPLVALYQLDYDAQWRSVEGSLAIAAGTPPPPNNAFLIFLPEARGETPDAPPLLFSGDRYSEFTPPAWAGAATGTDSQ